MYEQNGNINRETENIKNQNRNTGAKKYNNWNKSLLQQFKSRFGQAEETISEPER